MYRNKTVSGCLEKALSSSGEAKLTKSACIVRTYQSFRTLHEKTFSLLKITATSYQYFSVRASFLTRWFIFTRSVEHGMSTTITVQPIVAVY